MASAYATIAAGGIYSEPVAIRKVVLADGAGGQDAGWGQPDRHRVIADWVAAEVTRILEANVQGGTGVGANIGRPAGGKTGTTENHADAWFCGITPTLSASVWVGYPQAEIPMTNVHGISVAGGTVPGHDLEALHGVGDRLDTESASSRRRTRSRSGARSRAGSTPARSTSLRRYRRRAATTTQRGARRTGPATAATPTAATAASARAVPPAASA